MGNVGSAEPAENPDEQLQEYKQARIRDLEESIAIYNEVHGGKPYINLEEFDEIFGHILGDAEVHFPTFRQTADSSDPDFGVKGREFCDPREIFSAAAIIADDPPKPKIRFIFDLFADQPEIVTKKSFCLLIETVSWGNNKLVGTKKLDMATVDNFVESVFGRNNDRESATFRDIWKWCQDNVAVGQYMTYSFSHGLNQSTLSHTLGKINTSSYLGSSALMNEDSDSDDEDYVASGISKDRPPLFGLTIRQDLACPRWWSGCPCLNVDDHCLPALRWLLRLDAPAAAVFDHSGRSGSIRTRDCRPKGRFVGLVDASAFAMLLVRQWQAHHGNSKAAVVSFSYTKVRDVLKTNSNKRDAYRDVIFSDQFVFDAVEAVACGKLRVPIAMNVHARDNICHILTHQDVLKFVSENLPLLREVANQPLALVVGRIGKPVFHCASTTTTLEVLQILISKDVEELILVDSNDAPIATFTARRVLCDLIEGWEPVDDGVWLPSQHRLVLRLPPKTDIENLCRLPTFACLQQPVAEFVAEEDGGDHRYPNAATVCATETVATAIDAMVACDSSHIHVVGAKDEAVGPSSSLLTTTDIVQWLLDDRAKEEEEEKEKHEEERRAVPGAENER